MTRSFRGFAFWLFLATLVIGHSIEGRQITATRVGEADAPVKVLVVGDVHGNEPAGEAIVARLRSVRVDGVAFGQPLSR